MCAYEVTARRWRPRSFGDVVGQDHVVRTLRNAIDAGRVAHAYLFVGPRGTGKTSMARLLAMELVGGGDGNSELRSAIWRGEHMDVSELDGASNNSIDDVRALRERCAYGPAVGRRSVFIIDEVHMFSSAAFNGLLKILEEPPAHVVFIFATTEMAKMPQTVLSRCQRFNFRPMAADAVVCKLRQIAAAENVDATEDALRAIARLGGGSMRDAQTMFDQMVTYGGGKMDEAAVGEMYGVAPAKEVGELGDALMNMDAVGAISIVERWHSSGVDLPMAFRALEDALMERLAETFRSGRCCRAMAELVRTLRSYGRALPHAASEMATVAMAMVEAVENSRRRPVEWVIDQLLLARLEGQPAALFAEDCVVQRKS
jgi:DNA polymerase-3 subunit gamma/tau